MKLKCSHVDTCLPCYWSGHHLPYVQIPVDRGMTLKEIKSRISEELRMGYVMGSDKDARLLSADIVNPEDEKQAYKLTKAAYAAVNRIKPSKKGQRKFFINLEKSDENDGSDSIYAYFVFIECN